MVIYNIYIIYKLLLLYIYSIISYFSITFLFTKVTFPLLFPFLLISRKKKQLQRIGIEIDSDLWADFRAFVRKKHGRIHVVLALEVENALKRSISNEENLNEEYLSKNIDIDSNKIPYHTHNNEMKIIEKIKENYCDGTEICFKHLCQLIIQSTDLSDDRTHKKYVNSLIAKGILIEDPLSEKYECYILNLSKPPPI